METLGNWEKQSYILKPDKKLSFKLISERGEKNNFLYLRWRGLSFIFKTQIIKTLESDHATNNPHHEGKNVLVNF